MTNIEAHDCGYLGTDAFNMNQYLDMDSLLLARPANISGAIDWMHSSVGVGLLRDYPRNTLARFLAMGREAGVGTYKMARCVKGAPVALDCRGGVVTVPSVSPDRLVTPINWRMAFSFCMVLRDKGGLLSLVDAVDTIDHFREYRGGVTDEYSYSLSKTMAALHANARWWDGSLEITRQQVDSAHVGREWARMERPLIEVLFAIGQNDSDMFNRNMAEYLMRWKKYYSRRSRFRDPEGLFALVATGLSAWAYDRGLEIEISSDYMPEWMVRGELPVIDHSLPLEMGRSER